MRCNPCVQILLGLCISCHSCPQTQEGLPPSFAEDKRITTQASPPFSRAELEVFLAFWEALAKASADFNEKAFAQQRRLPVERMEAMETWAMQWSARCAVPLPEEKLPNEVETQTACWEELRRISGEEAGRWLEAHHRQLMRLWEAWLKP